MGEASQQAVADNRIHGTTRQQVSGLAQTLDVRPQEAAGHQLSHAEFLELILQDELLVRSERLIDRRVTAAAFRELKSLDEFDWSFNPSAASVSAAPSQR